MKLLCYSLPLLLSLSLISNNSYSKGETTTQVPPYLGQKPPGKIPELFAPDLIKTEHREAEAAFSPDLTEFYFRRRGGENKRNVLVVMQYKNNQWIESAVPPRAGEPFVSVDGKTLFLGSKYRNITSSGLSEVKSLGAPFENTRIMRLTESAKGTYFFDDVDSNTPIRYSRLINGKYEQPKTLDIDIGQWNAHPFIAPDESYLIWDDQRKSGHGKADLYISFRLKDGTWSNSINLGDKINTEYSEAYGSVSPDGKYFFFHRSYGGDKGDIHWVDAQFIEAMRPN